MRADPGMTVAHSSPRFVELAPLSEASESDDLPTGLPTVSLTECRAALGVLRDTALRSKLLVNTRVDTVFRKNGIRRYR